MINRPVINRPVIKRPVIKRPRNHATLVAVWSGTIPAMKDWNVEDFFLASCG